MINTKGEPIPLGVVAERLRLQEERRGERTAEVYDLAKHLRETDKRARAQIALIVK